MTKMHRKLLHLQRKAVLRPGGATAPPQPPQLQQQPQHVRQTLPLSEQTSTRLESAKKLFSCARFSEALGELDALQQQHPEETMASELAARVLLWRAKCLRQGDQCDWNDIQKLLRRAFDKLAASVAVAEGLRHSIVLELIVASVARQKLPSTNTLSTEKVMEMCCCPISFEVMSDPVVTPSGVSYERAMIERHLEMVGKFDPMTHAKLTKAQLYPNRMLKQLVEMTLAAFDPTAGEACQVQSD
jgi:hypothetical protein